MKTGSGVYYSSIIKNFEKKGYENAALYGVQSPFEGCMQQNVLKFPVLFKSEILPFPIAGMSDKMPYESTIYSQMNEEMFEQWSNEFRRVLLKAKEEFNPDIILCHHVFLLANLTREIFKDIPVFVISHGTDIRQAKKNPWIIHKYGKKLNTMDKYLALTPFDAKDLKKMYGVCDSKVSIVGAGYDESIFYPHDHEGFSGKIEDKVKIIYAGKLAKAKGVYELVQTLPILEKKFDGLELDIVADSSIEEQEELGKLSNYSKNLNIYPATCQKHLSDIMRDCHIFVLPSYYEGLGLVAVEALACHMRVVCTEIQGLMWLLGDEVNSSCAIEYVKLPRLYDVDKPYEEDKPAFIKNLADALSLQIERVQRGAEFNKRVSDSVNTHSWKDVSDRLEQEIKSII